MFIIGCFEGISKQSDHIFIQEWGMYLDNQISPPLSIFTYSLFIFLFLKRQTIPIRNNFYVVFVLLNERIYKILPPLDFHIVQLHILA